MNVITRVCPQCGNATQQAVCSVDGWSTVPQALLADRGIALGAVLLDRFRVGALLRVDGAVAIYGGLDQKTALPVHINIIPIPSGTPLDVVGRMQRAARTLETVRHPTLVSVLATGTTERGDLAIVSERVSGPTLADKLRIAPLAPTRTAAMGHALFAGLEVAHAAGVAHHDLSPERIVVPTDERVVIDRIGLFDLLRMARPESDDALLPHGLAYGAPELARDKLVTRQADVYSVGAILYESLTGKPVFDEATPADRLVAHLTREPEQPTVNGVPMEGPLVELILHCLVKKPWNRPDGAGAARIAFEGACKGPVAWPVENTPLPEVPQPEILLTRPFPAAELVPPPLITRDAGRPRVEARTQPFLSRVGPLSPRRNSRRAVWPWLALAALSALCAWPIIASIGGSGRAPMTAERNTAMALERPTELAAEAKAAADAKIAADAQVAAEAKIAADARVAAEAKTAADAQVAAEAKIAADARVAAEARAAADAHIAAEARAAADAHIAAEAKVAADAKAIAAKTAEAKAAAVTARAKQLAATKPASDVTPAGTWSERKAEVDAHTRAAEARRIEANARWQAKVEATRQPTDVKPGTSATTRGTAATGGPDLSPDRRDTPPAAAFRRLAVSSTPSNAKVTVDGRVVGYTPAVLTWAPGGQGRAVVTLEGFEPRSVDFDDKANGRSLMLDLVKRK